jgi:hypothetical protein
MTRRQAWRWRLDAIVTHFHLTWRGCVWCGERHGWEQGALHLREDSAVNSRVSRLLPNGYYHLRCWNLTKWFDLTEARNV